MSAEPDGLDDLAGTGTVRVDAGELTVLSVFAHSREHLMEASRNTLRVPVGRAKSVADFTGMVADAARVAGPDTWVLTAMTWHESNLAENAGPTRPGCRRLSPPRRHPSRPAPPQSAANRGTRWLTLGWPTWPTTPS